MSHGVIGWDIGGVNTKVARIQRGAIVAAHSEPFEVQRDPTALAALLRTLASRVGMTGDDRHAVTMTAELSQMFRTKRDGVSFVLDAVTAAFPSSDVHVFTVDGRFLTPGVATGEPLAVAASNWAETATIVARSHPEAILIDTGTTTTDIIPIVRGAPSALGATDPDRLASGELVYTGALRTPIEAVTQHVPVGGSLVAVSAESVALIGDVHLWRGELDAADYSVTSPDGRPASREFAGERIARVICADREMLDDRAIGAIADAIAATQVDLIARAVRKVRRQHPSLHTAIVAGLGSFIAERAAQQAGLNVIRLADALGSDASRSAPAAAVALLLDAPGQTTLSPWRRGPNESSRTVDTVFKIGGSLLNDPTQLDATIGRIVEGARTSRVAVVPGGGPFADAVRHVDRRLDLTDETAHWMAVLAMDQYAHLIASRHPDLALAASPGEVRATLDAQRIPVIASYQWLARSDPLPHSWDVTSDSISAWFATELGARQLVLVKSRGADTNNAVDPYFARTVTPDLAYSVVTADALGSLSSIDTPDPAPR